MSVCQSYALLPHKYTMHSSPFISCLSPPSTVHRILLSFVLLLSLTLVLAVPTHYYPGPTTFSITADIKNPGEPFYNSGDEFSFRVNSEAVPILYLVSNVNYTFTFSSAYHALYFSLSKEGYGASPIANLPTLTDGTSTIVSFDYGTQLYVMWYECMFHTRTGNRLYVLPQNYSGDFNFTGLTAGLHYEMTTTPVSTNNSTSNSTSNSNSNSTTPTPPPSTYFPTATTFSVTFGAKQPGDPFFNDGSTDEFYINSLPAPPLYLTRGVTYTFTTSITAFHAFYFTSSSSGAGVGQQANTQIIFTGQQGTLIPDPTGANNEIYVLWYQCAYHTRMGNRIYVLPANYAGTWDLSSLHIGTNIVDSNIVTPPTPTPTVDRSYRNASSNCSIIPFSLQLLAGYTLSWKVYPEAGLIELEMAAKLSPGRGFVGLGIGASTMIDADLTACMLSSDNEPICLDAWTNYFQPLPDVSLAGGVDNVAAFSHVLDSDGVSHFTFTKPLNSSDRWDKAYQSKMMPFIFSYGKDSGLVYHGLRNRGSGQINFFNGQATLNTQSNYNVQLTHGVSMLIVWLLLYPTGGFVARYMKHTNLWLSIHEFCQKTGSLSVVSFAVMALVNSSNHFLTTHSVLGVTIACFLILNLSLGQFSKWRIRAVNSKPWHRWLARCHQFIGIFLMTMGCYQVKLGIELLFPFDELAVNLYFAAISIIASAYFTAEVYRQYSIWQHLKRTVTPDGMPQIHDYMLLPDSVLRNLREYSWTQISERIRGGSKWLVISNVIFDVRASIDSHPGGKTILEESLGTDSTHAFLGVQDEEGMLVHHHSSSAWRKLENLAVGRLLIDEEEEARLKMAEANTPHNIKLQTQRALNRLFQSRRVNLAHSKDPAATHFRYYKIIFKKNLTHNVLLLRFDQTTHFRPFIFKSVFTAGSDVAVDIRPPGLLRLSSMQTSYPITLPESQPQLENLPSSDQVPAVSAMSPASNVSPGIDTERGTDRADTSAIPIEQSALSSHQLALPSRRTLRVSHRTTLVAGAFNRLRSFVHTRQPSSNTLSPNAALNTNKVSPMPSGEPSKSNNDHLQEKKIIEELNHPADTQQPSKTSARAASPDDTTESNRVTTFHIPSVNVNAEAVNLPGSIPSPIRENTQEKAEINNNDDNQQQNPANNTSASSEPSNQTESAKENKLLSSLRKSVDAFSSAGRSNANRKFAGTSREPHILLPGEHIELATYMAGESVERYYTPFPTADPKCFEIIVKLYPKGLMSNFLLDKSVGDFVKVRGPIGAPLVNSASSDGSYQIMLLISAGTGITPFLQLINFILCLNRNKPSHQRTHMVLLGFYHSQADMILPDLLNDYAKSSEGCLHIFYSLTEPKPKPDSQWSGLRGRPTADMVQQALHTLTHSYLMATKPVQSPSTTSTDTNSTSSRLYAPYPTVSHPLCVTTSQAIFYDQSSSHFTFDGLHQRKSKLPHASSMSKIDASTPARSSIMDRIKSKFAKRKSVDGNESTPLLNESKQDVIDEQKESEPLSPSSTTSLRRDGIPSHRIVMCGPIDFEKAVLSLLVESQIKTDCVDCM